MVREKLGLAVGVIVILSFFLCTIAEAQGVAASVKEVERKSDIRVELGVGFSLISDFNTFLPYWKNGLGVGGSISYVVSQDIQLLASLSYSRFEYSGRGPTLAIPRVVGFRRDITGDASHIYEASVGVRLVRSGYFIKPFISIRSGIQLTQVGKILVTTWQEQEPQNKFTYVYWSSGKTFSKAFASVGLGVEVPVSSRFNILLEGMFSSTFDLSQQYCPIFATLQFEL
jgi:hypothetical protein